MSTFTTRQISIEDIQALQDISRTTFLETFSEGNTEENMKKYLEEGFSAGKLRTELNNPNSSFYFALTANTPVGYLKINFGDAQTELKESSALEIERIYVLKEWQGKKIGQILFQKALDMAIEKDVEYLWLGVWEENKKAISFYTRNGFVAFDQHIFVLGDDEQMDIMMRLDLKKGYIPKPFI